MDAVRGAKLNDVALETRDTVQTFTSAHRELLAVSAHSLDGILDLRLHICMLAGVQPPREYLSKYPPLPTTELPALKINTPNDQASNATEAADSIPPQ